MLRSIKILGRRGISQGGFQGFRLAATRHFSLLPSQEDMPTMETAMAMPREYYEMTNECLLLLACSDDQNAHKERLLREVMAVDKVSWVEAHTKVAEINAANRSGKVFWHLPYKTGVVLAVVSGFASFPLVFDLQTALWFNENFVTTDVPGGEDLETVLETGSWTWNWMEPPLGQASFLLLCLQFARAQLDNMGVRPYNGYLIHMRARRLQEKYPMYNDNILSDFSKNLDIISAQPEVGAKSSSLFDGR